MGPHDHLSPETLEEWAKGRGTSREELRHMDLCLLCSQAFREAQEYFQAVESLSFRKAPDGFAARLRDRIEGKKSDSPAERFLRALFLPWQVKIPLGLAGAGLACLLVFLALPARRAPAPLLSQ